MITKCFNSSGKEVWFNTATQTMVEIPKETGFMGANGVFYPVFDSIEKFLSSGKKQAIIHAYLNSKTKKGKRFIYNFELYFGNLELFNFEHTKIGWINHEVNNCFPLNAYRMLIERNNYCVNNIKIIFTKQLNK